MSESEPNWKKIATELAERVVQVLGKPRGEMGNAMFLNLNGPAGKTAARHWRDDFADALEMIPGFKVDREMSRLMDRPAKQRDKAIAELKAKRAATPTEKGPQ